MSDEGPQKQRFTDVAVATLLALGYVALLLATVKDLGYARDEGFYFAAADSYAKWFELLVRDPAQALTRATLDRYWAANHEHPALMKSLFAVSHRLLFSEWKWFGEPGTAYRFPGMLVSGVAIAITYLWATRLYGRLSGVVAAVLLGMMPRVFYHSHLACFDMPVASMWLVTTYAYWRSLTAKSWAWPIATGVLYGLLLNTKHNAWLLPPALVLHYVLGNWRALRRGLRVGTLRAPSALLAMLIIGPLVFYATWPWIWSDTGARLAEYVAFHTGHDYYNMEFLGETYWKAPMPRLYAPLMTLATVPLVTLLLAALGAALAIRTRPRLSQSHLLWALCIFTSYGPWLSDKTPIFGGTKHWITAYPFLCLFAAFAFSWLRQRLVELPLPRGRGVRQSAGIALAVALTAGPCVMTLHSHPWQLSSYMPIVGGPAGAATLGLNRTFWGYTTGALQSELNGAAPRAGSVFVHDTALQSWDTLKADGRLRRDLRGSLNVSGTDLALYHHESHMGKVEYQIWVDYGTVRPLHVGTFDGVPVVWLYQRHRP
jgi:4-amino-4-deoxy-L-arabinose transferase-like glycosyltransferase